MFKTLERNFLKIFQNNINLFILFNIVVRLPMGI